MLMEEFFTGKPWDKILFSLSLFFWTIRGGGEGSFGIITSWKVKLAPAP